MGTGGMGHPGCPRVVLPLQEESGDPGEREGGALSHSPGGRAAGEGVYFIAASPWVPLQSGQWLLAHGLGGGGWGGQW